MRGITTLYPGALSTWEPTEDHVTPVDKVFLDSIGYEFYAIEYTLGTDVNKGFNDVAARLSDQESDISQNESDITSNTSRIAAVEDDYVKKSGGSFEGNVGFNYYNLEYGYLYSMAGLNFCDESITVKGIKDEDDMSSDSAEHLATQQSIKARFDKVHNSRVRVTKNNAQTFNYATVTTVQYDDEVYDGLGEFASYTFTPTNAGYYYIAASLSINGGTYNTNVGRDSKLIVYVNGVATAVIGQFTPYPNANHRVHTIGGSTVLYLAAGASGAVTIRMYQNWRVSTSGQNLVSDTVAERNWLSIHRVS